MKKSSTLFLKIVILLIAAGVLTGLLWFPQTEGRAAGLDLISIYADPFILYIYIASTPFFVGLFQAFKLLNLIDANRAFSQSAVNTIKNMKLASLSLIGLIAVTLFYLRFFAHGDDLAGPTMLGICMSVAFGVIATAASVFQKLFQNAVDLKSENDLTV
ncbi:DUF2975 domain-containing protein [Patescibacteria group bacterium]|nr:DUF2975 domain-containing protein [Patescibacteria group bacterium]